MRVLSGDLSPARHHRRGGSYGRRRHRRGRLRTSAAVLALLAVGGAGYYALHRNDTSAAGRRAAAAAAACRTGVARTAPPPVGLPSLPRPAAVRLTLLNGTPRNGLGRNVGAQLAARGFAVAVAGNAPRPQLGASRVLFGPGGGPGGMLAARTVLGATLAANPKLGKGAVQVVLGSTFRRLRTPAEVAGMGRPAVASAAAGPRPVGCR